MKNMFCRLIIEKFIEMASDIKDIELHFTIGDALVFCALGCLSPASRDVWTVSEEETHIESNSRLTTTQILLPKVNTTRF